MERISRRGALGLAAATLASGVMAGQGDAAPASPSDAKKKGEPAGTGKGESIYKFRMGQAEAQKYGDSIFAEHKLDHFPACTAFAGAVVHLAPGDFREPHWHPNSDEYIYVISGTIRMTIVNTKGEASRFTCGPEDVAFVPIGFGHYVESIGDKEAIALIVHNHAEFTTIDLSDWVAGGSTPIFASTLNMAADALDAAPKKRVFITKKKAK